MSDDIFEDDIYDDDDYYESDDDEFGYDDADESFADDSGIDIQAAIDEFQAETDRNIEILKKNKNTKEKIKAAKWLGESGNTSAIPVLVQAYKKIKDKGVQNAVAYALGQFKALDEAIERDIGVEAEDALGDVENQMVNEQINNIILYKQFGSSRKVPQALLMVIFSILLVTFLVLGSLTGANVMEIVNATAVPTAPPTPTPLPDLPPDQLTMLFALQDLRGKYDETATVLDGVQKVYASAFEGSLDCTATLTELTPFDTPVVADAVNAGYAQQADELNSIIGEINGKIADYNAACSPENEASQQDAATLMREQSGALGEIRNRLIAFNTAFDDFEHNNGFLDLTPVPIDPNITPEPPTEVPTATPDVRLETEAREVIASLEFKLAEVTKKPSGALAQLEQFWSDVENSGGTGGCDRFTPAIPEDFVLSEELAAANPDLAAAVTDANTGLQTVRDGWQTFQTACAAGTLTTTLANGQAQVQLAEIALETALSSVSRLK